jgi:hypothetical protein
VLANELKFEMQNSIGRYQIRSRVDTRLGRYLRVRRETRRDESYTIPVSSSRSILDVEIVWVCDMNTNGTVMMTIFKRDRRMDKRV